MLLVEKSFKFPGMNGIKRDIGARLQEIRRELGLTQEEMGARIDKGKGSISKYENGDAEPPYSVLEKYAEISDKNFNWIFTGKSDWKIPCAADKEAVAITTSPREDHKEDLSEVLAEYVKVPRYEVAASAGGGAVVESEQIVDYLLFGMEWVKNTLGVNPKRLALISVVGDSMSPSYNDGDLILVDTSTGRPKSDAVYVLQHDSCLWVKRLHFHFDGSVAVISDNPRYPEQTISGEALQRLQIIGRVMWRGGK